MTMKMKGHWGPAYQAMLIASNDEKKTNMKAEQPENKKKKKDAQRDVMMEGKRVNVRKMPVKS